MDTPRTGAKWVSHQFVGELAAESDEFGRAARLGTTKRRNDARTDVDRRCLEPSQNFARLVPETISRRRPGGYVLSRALKLLWSADSGQNRAQASWIHRLQKIRCPCVESAQSCILARSHHDDCWGRAPHLEVQYSRPPVLFLFPFAAFSGHSRF